MHTKLLWSKVIPFYYSHFCRVYIVSSSLKDFKRFSFYCAVHSFQSLAESFRSMNKMARNQSQPANSLGKNTAILEWEGIFGSSQLRYPNDPRILTYVKKRLTFFRLLSRLNELDLCGLLCHCPSNCPLYYKKPFIRKIPDQQMPPVFIQCGIGMLFSGN